MKKSENNKSTKSTWEEYTINVQYLGNKVGEVFRP